MSELLSRFSNQISSATDSQLLADPSLGGRLSLHGEGKLSIFYAPFEWIEPGAKVVIAGITPGLQQASNALIEARRQLIAGKSSDEVLRAAKVFASFSGPMRSNLIAMLDHVGLNKWLNMDSCSSLWDGNLAHFTSVLRYPVLLDGKNYNGNPSMASNPKLLSCLKDFLAEEAAALPNAVWVPLGPTATLGVKYLASQGQIQPRNILEGLPHPSGANAERIAYFLGRKSREDLSAKTNAASLDSVRARLMAQVRALG